MNMPENCRWSAAAALVLGLMIQNAAAKGGTDKAGNAFTAATYFQTTNVWTVHLRFTADAWKAMQPEDSGNHPPMAGPEGPNLLGHNGGKNGLSAARGIEFKYVHADLELGTNRLKDVAVRLKGNSSFMQVGKARKYSFKVDLNEFVKGQKIGSLTKLNFHNNVADPSWMNEVLSYQLYRDAGVPAPKTAYAKVYVTVPGEHDRTYLGLYSMVEDVDRSFAWDHFGSKKGAVFKPVTHKLFDYLGDDWSNYRQIYDPKSELSEAQAKRLIEFCKLVSKADDGEFEKSISSFLDIDEFSRFLAVTVYLSTLDSLLGMGQNFYAHLHPVFQNFQFIPWDLDNSFGQFQMMGTQEEREQLSLQKPWVGENRFLERLFKVGRFQTFYKTHLLSFQVMLFKPERIQRQVENLAAIIRPAVQEESADKLAQFDRAVAGEMVAANRPGPRHPGGAARAPAGYLKPIKTFVKARSVSMSDQLAGRSEGETIESRSGPGGPSVPGPGTFLAPEWMGKADQNKDGKVTREEWSLLAAKWYGDWNKNGKLTMAELRSGIEAAFPPPDGLKPPDEFGPGVMLGKSFLQALDANKDGQVTRQEFQACFDKWFQEWNTNGTIDEEQLRGGISRELAARLD
ncbi:MAG: hypothetical protein JWM16_232 [Verrucomicrobiales bacterium]|nr:hypothetical protein [Verrucomicrobiales bacterium]